MRGIARIKALRRSLFAIAVEDTLLVNEVN